MEDIKYNDSLKKKVIESRYQPVTRETFAIISAYEIESRFTNDYDGLSLAYFCKGEAYLRQGKFSETITALEESLKYNKNSNIGGCEGVCYNTMGLVYAYQGYELNAMKYYFEGINFAQAHNDIELLSTLYINIGWLYYELGDTKKAIGCYEKAYVELQTLENSFSQELVDPEIMCQIYLGHAYFDLKNYDTALTYFYSAEKMLSTKKDLYYDVCLFNFYIRIFDYLDDKENSQKVFDSVSDILIRGKDFLEFLEFYIDLAEYFLEYNHYERAKIFVDYLIDRAEKIDLIYLKYRIKKLNIKFNELYGDRNSFLDACVKFIKIDFQYQELADASKVSSMENMELLNISRNQTMFYESLARHDNMTGLFNKNAAEYMIKQFLSKRNSGEMCIFAIMDLDKFKQINDTCGHYEGDRVIIKTTELMKQIFSQAEVLGRFGGDEFVVFYKHVSGFREPFKLFEEFKKRVHSEISTKESGVEVEVSTSIGIVYTRRIDISYTDLFNEADNLLYESKEKGRNRITFVEYQG
ncbi:diguanylate cyclase (GGDEF) domain-containing protein [Acetitomaculum ruminis DSM 5522]|uniref:Diguanylate cyclase (GGDEF) domain-containing protein n=1 Tax=Acetitomaculum ruminis DSM 5522 TaxID=1120918 RepID=A0A1I0XD14_9FIRM|nr:tetratricopeptide repeat-containing diguanylate cyclase [Acetitomaculum ruminis]SFA98922.1 diguanylate cyclase (GGDEF) domain-containing protein [Acetitomaculum ruminis DSM 5522]